MMSVHAHITASAGRIQSHGGSLRFAPDARYRQAMTSDLLFVYGTLMRGFDHPMARLLAANADFISEASCRGRLYLVKHYPGLVLFRLREVDAMLREFDMYEACGEGFPEPTEYVRRQLAVTLADGSMRDAWTYLYNWSVDDLPRIASGRFLEH